MIARPDPHFSEKFFDSEFALHILTSWGEILEENVNLIELSISSIREFDRIFSFVIIKLIKHFTINNKMVKS